MSYDFRTAGQYDAALSRATSQAKSWWGSGWAHLTDEMQTAYVCYFLVGQLGGTDFDAAFEGRLEEPGVPEKLLSRLRDIQAVCAKAHSK
jgi:hypothetical protein